MGPQFEDLTVKQVLLYFVLPMMIGVCTIFYAFHLKRQELITYHSDTLRIALNIAGGGITLLSGLMLTMTFFAKLCDYFGLLHRGQAKPLGQVLFISGTFIAGIGTFLYTMWRLDEYNRKLELDALKQLGRRGTVAVEDVRYKSGKHVYYEFVFHITGTDKRRHELSVTGRDAAAMNIGDSLALIYLPGNPTVFREEYDLLYPERK